MTDGIKKTTRYYHLINYESGARVVLGRNRHNIPPPINRAATMKVGAGQYVSNNMAITILPIIPPRRAATIDIATPVALLKTK